MTAPKRKAELQELWDEWWYDRFEIPNDVPPGARQFQIEVDGEERFRAVLLENAAPRTCDAFWEILPLGGNIIHCAFFGHAAFYVDRIELGVDELENRSSRLAPGEFIWDPLLKEITFAYGRHAGVRFPTTPWFGDTPHPNQVCIFARIAEDLDRWAAMCKSTRYRGTRHMVCSRL